MRRIPWVLEVTSLQRRRKIAWPSVTPRMHEDPGTAIAAMARSGSVGSNGSARTCRATPLTNAVQAQPPIDRFARPPHRSRCNATARCVAWSVHWLCAQRSTRTGQRSGGKACHRRPCSICKACPSPWFCEPFPPIVARCRGLSRASQNALLARVCHVRYKGCYPCVAAGSYPPRAGGRRCARALWTRPRVRPITDCNGIVPCADAPGAPFVAPHMGLWGRS